MQKILVTTDFSTASKPGMRFAIQLATQMEVELVFFHLFQALIPTTVHRNRIERALQEQGIAQQKKLEQFVDQMYTSMQVEAAVHRCVALECLYADSCIEAYAQQNGFQFICMSTHGAGVMRQIIGTQTGRVLQRSSVPVLVVQHTYRVQPIQEILYASDLENFDPEMATVSAFAEVMQVKIDLAHFYYPGEISLDLDTLTRMWRMKYPQLGQIHLEQHDLDRGFSDKLDELAKKTEPSIIVFFAHAQKTWFDQWFGASVSESVSYMTRVPMLVYRKVNVPFEGTNGKHTETVQQGALGAV